ncbi:YrhC family protein [Metabacillus idriensis]|uniref:YrhC family protein n=1 Tax=Metabacillus idriensis TaxID=324768 RepID=UPI0017483E7D|nr:YrhC family protein [Metabacillus idriensis]
MNRKQVKQLMTDYKRFAFAMLAVSVFLYIGMLIPAQGQDPNAMKEYVMMGTTSVFLLASFLCFKRSITYKKRLEEEEA